MKTANIAEFKKHFSAFLAQAEKGETVEIQRRNVPIAHLVGLPLPSTNRTVLGCGKGSVLFHGPVAEPLIAADEWEMLADQDART